MSCYPPDLTGQNPKYKVTDKTLVMFQDVQKVVFDTPVFLESIAITNMDVPPPRPRCLRGEEWDVNEDDIDVTTKAHILVNSPEFDKTLVKSLTFTKNQEPTQTIQLKYQQLFPADGYVPPNENECVDFTPELLSDMLERLNWVERQSTSIERVESDPLSPIPELLAEDPHRQNPDNVHTEKHFINVFNGQNIIRPSTGSFFRDSVVVRIPNHCDLEPDKDYIVYHTNIPKTKISNNTSGVYDYILITYGFAGEVEITTHAYGGEITQDSFKSLSEAVSSVARFLKDQTPLTQGSLPQIPAFQTLDARLTCLEDQMRSLVTTGRPTFGDATAPGSVAKIYKLQSTDMKFHWWSLATLFKIDGSEDIIRADRIRYRLRMVESKISVDIILHVDMRLKNPFQLETVGLISDTNTVSQYDEDLPATASLVPHFRILWNDDMTTPSGVILQIGFRSPAFIETVAIEDFSGVESCWILITHDDDPVRPRDNTIVLPDEASVWDKSNSISRQESRPLPHPEGYVMWQGSATLEDGTGVDVTSVLDAKFQHLHTQKLSFVVTVDGVDVLLEGTVARSSNDTSLTVTVPNSPIQTSETISLFGTLSKTSDTLDLSITPTLSTGGDIDVTLRQIRVHV